MIMLENMPPFACFDGTFPDKKRRCPGSEREGNARSTNQT
jgi:hypothetical protein